MCARKYWTTTLEAALSSIDTVILFATSVSFAVFVSIHHADQMTEGFQTSKVPLSVQNPKMAVRESGWKSKELFNENCRW